MIDASRATIAILTALPKECAAVRSMLEDEERVPGPAGDGQRAYYVGRIPAGNNSHVVVVALLPDMANNSAAASATRLLADFKQVKHLIMCGIAGGVPKPGDPEHDVRLGDIVVSNRHGVVQYDLIKERPDGSKEHRHPPRPPGAALLGAVRHLQTEEVLGKRPWEAWLARGAAIAHGQRPGDDRDARGEPIGYPDDPNRRPGLPRVFEGTIAAANILLKNAAHRDYLGKTFGVKAVEMEGAGVADAAWFDGAGYLVVRGICDYCDEKKGDAWQGAAAVAAAAYTCAVVAAMPGPRVAAQRAAGPRAPKPASKPGRKKPAAAAAPPTAPALEQDPGSGKAPGARLRVLVFHGPDNASKNELLAWLRGPAVNVDARTVGEMVPTAAGVVDDRVDHAIAWADKFIAVVTPDPRSPSGAPNVIDEIGRVRGAGRGADLSILRQRTCADLWSNLAGVVRIEFDERPKEVWWPLAGFLGIVQTAEWEPRREVPSSPRTSPSRAEDPPAQPVRDDRAQALRAWLEERLTSAPRAVALIAASAPMQGRVAVAVTPAAVADALLAASASTVAQALNDAHAKADASTRPALAELMFRVLPFTADLAGARQRATAAVARGERTIELPFRFETLAEIVSAGVDGRPIEVDVSPAFPLGLRSVVIPPTSYAPLFASHNEVFVQDVVVGLCHEKGDVSDEFVKLKSRFGGRSPEELRRTVQMLLRKLHDHARPRYLLFIDEDLKHETERSVDELWGLVRGAVEHPERGLAGLRLIRLKGGIDEVESEYEIAVMIRAVVNGP